MCSAIPHLVRLGFLRSLTPSSPSTTRSSIPSTTALRSSPVFKSYGTSISRQRCNLRHCLYPISAADEDFMDGSLMFEDGDEISGESSFYAMYSSDGEESDGDIIVNPIGDLELPLSREHQQTPEDALTLAAHRFATIQRGHRKKRTQPGVMFNLGLITFLALLLSFVDWCSWKIVRLPLEPYFLTKPFSISTVLSACAGCMYVPIADSMRVQQMLRNRGAIEHSSKRKISTMGGLFFVPIGIIVARSIAGLTSIQVNGAALATLAFAAIGLFDDLFKCCSNYNYRLPGWIKFLLQAAVGSSFSFWLYTTKLPTPYSMRLLVPLPPPYGLVHLGKFYLVMTTLCFIAMGNGVSLTDGLDGLVGGVSALAFIGMSIAVLPLCPDLAIFGASMAGACIGFLFHNRYKASIVMGGIGSLALGGALAAMAACTGMFLPLFLSSGVFVIELLSVIIQVLFMKSTLRLVHRLKPLHYHLKSRGIKEPLIVAGGYIIACALALSAGFAGLISA